MPYSTIPFLSSLRSQITLLVCAASFFSIILVGAINYLQTSEILVQNAVEGLASETRLMASRFKRTYTTIENDASLVAKTPPIEGIIRSIHNNNIDPTDTSTTYQWRSRLETIFKSVMNSRPHYTQIRYIGVEDNGRELVRVNRSNGKFVVTKPNELQQKSDEPYFQKGLTLKEGEVYFSEVTYNRENGKIDPSLTPTLRAILPIYNDENSIFGFIAINANYPLMLRQALKETPPTKHTYLVNDTGDYLEYNSREAMIGRFEFHENYINQTPDFIKQIRLLNTPEASLSDEQYIRYFTKIRINEKINTNTFFGVLLEVPRAELLETVYSQRLELLLYSLGVVFLIIITTAWILTRFTNPLNAMTRTLLEADENTDELDLPVHLNNELGALAKAFNKMAYRLKESQSKSNAIINNVVDGIITIDLAGIVQSFNPACERMFGYQASEVIGKNIKLLMPETYSSKHDKYLKSYKQTGKKKIIGIGREVEAQRKDGSIFPIELSISEVEIGTQKIFSGILRDITERKQMDNMKDEFVSTVNHELRTPLTAIKTSLEILMVKIMDSIDEKSQRTLNICYKNCEHLTTLVNDILDMEKIAAGKMEYNIQPVELCNLVKDVTLRHKDFAEKYNVTYSLNIESDLVYVKTDEIRLSQCIGNLLSNAAKFSDEEGVVLVSLSQKTSNKVQIAIQDHGFGIPESFKSKIFSKFAQADGSASRIKGGSGLGLNITKSMVEAFKGKIYFESEEGKGTTFFIELPTTKAPKQ